MSRPTALIFPDNLAALAICRELGSVGVPTIVLGTSRSGPAAYSRFARFVRCPDLYQKPQEWVDFLIAFGRELQSPAVLFPTEDAGLLIAEAHYRALSNHFLYSYAAPGVVSKLLDKSSLYQMAQAAGVAVPRYRVIEDASTVVREKGRWIAKPFCRYRLEDGRVHSFLRISGGNKALGGDPTGAATRILRAGFPAMLQEELPGSAEELVSVGLCLSPSGELLSSFTSRKRCQYPEPFGDGLVVEPARDPGVTEQSVRLLRSIGYWGICDVEFKRDPRDGIFKLLDANPRAWLWMGLATAGGCYLARNAYQIATGGSAFRGPARSWPIERWVCARGALGFLLRFYRPRKHGLRLPLGLVGGSLKTALYNWREYRDPLYLRPSSWIGLAATFVQPIKRRNSPPPQTSPRRLGAGRAASVTGGK